MKRFLIGIGFSIVMISTGCAISVFELKDYRVVNAYEEMNGKVETLKTTVSTNDHLRLELDTYVEIKYEIDNELDDMVELDVHEYLDYRFSKNNLRVDAQRWYNIPFGEYLDKFLEGLKDEKMYIYNKYNPRIDKSIITIRCSDKAKEYIRVIED